MYAGAAGWRAPDQRRDDEPEPGEGERRSGTPVTVKQRLRSEPREMSRRHAGPTHVPRAARTGQLSLRDRAMAKGNQSAPEKSVGLGLSSLTGLAPFRYRVYQHHE